MALIQEVEWEACTLEPGHNRELEQFMRQRVGFVPAVARYFADCPWVARGHALATPLFGALVHVSLPLAEKIIVVVSQDNSCRYCFSANRMLLRMLGIPAQHINRIEQDLLTADLAPGERAVLTFARRLSRSNPLLTPRDLEPLQAAGYSSASIREIALIVGFACMGNRIATLAALPPEWVERVNRGVLQPLLPVVGRFVRRGWGRGKPDHFAHEVQEGPFSNLVVAFDGLPIGRALWQVLDEAWTSEILPRRTKGLMFAVVARALGCAESEAEAGRVLRMEGMTGDRLRPVLAHLSGADLDAVETLLVPFARETVWYQPAPIQRSVRKLRERLTTAQTQEAIGITALANLVSRLCVVAHTP